MLQVLLPVWKEAQWKPYIKGFDSDATELVRVCTLESGVFQAACASERVSISFPVGMFVIHVCSLRVSVDL